MQKLFAIRTYDMWSAGEYWIPKSTLQFKALEKEQIITLQVYVCIWVCVCVCVSVLKPQVLASLV